MALALTNSKYFLFLAVILLVQGIFPLKFLAIPLLLPFILKYIRLNNLKIDLIAKFYVVIFVIGFFSFSFELIKCGTRINELILVLFSSFLWLFFLFIYLILKRWIEEFNFNKIDGLILLLFKINTIFCFFQYLILLFTYKSINPFSTVLAGSAGDKFVGIFSNSSANMVINSFFLIYFLSTKRNKFKYIAIPILVMLSTTYMSGLFGFLLALLIFFIVSKRISIKIRFITIIILSLTILVIYIISYDNINYAYTILETVFSLNRPRKIQSFLDTIDFVISDPKFFLLGSSPAHFSSRVAFIGGGQFVDWYPAKLTYLSNYFDKFHFQLWNNDVLAIEFNDGTANQPFSVYNQLIGEYGIVGILSFISLYLRGIWIKLKGQIYSVLIFTSLLIYFFLDYWFEYISTIIILELIILSINKYKNSETIKQ